MMRLLPRSLFGRLVGVLAVGLVLAQVASAWINWSERDRMLVEVAGMQPVQRIADIVRLLDSAAPAERQRIAGILDAPPLVLRLGGSTLPPGTGDEASPQARMVAAMLHAALGGERALRVAVTAHGPAGRAAAPPWMEQHRMTMRGPRGEARPGWGRGASGIGLVTRVQLADGLWVTFDTGLPRESASLPLRLLATLTMLLLIVLGLSFIAMRWLSRPLRVLAEAAEALGKNIHRGPLPEDGPTEVVRAAQAFNRMQARLVRYIDDRTRVLAAISHDLKTPLTRLRLRAELLDDGELRERFDKDLQEMQAMVTDALAALRGLEGPAQTVPVDMMALLESLQADSEELGRAVEIEGCARAPLLGDPLRLKRCVGNLVENAVVYGRRAHVAVDDAPAALTLRIRDEGPGIPAPLLERAFDPFFRLEGSRSRETGGTGLGLSIARSIAREAGGEVSLRNLPAGGLEACLVLPR
ncbi:MAG: HAMP domain-containing protein [Burkholderiales bacterium]|nr:HAMP domain-containing protein [Burkholderiales bacterium]